MSDSNYPTGVNEGTINKHFGDYFTDWFEQHYDYLLDTFYQRVFEKFGVELPDFDKWNYETLIAWEKFVDEAWENAPQP